MAIDTPQPGEYPPTFQRYVDLVPIGEYLDVLERSSIDSTAFFQSIPEPMHAHRYAPDKWTVKQILMHVIDTERVFTTRALAAARGDESPFYRMDEELYARNVDVSDRPWSSLVAEFQTVRAAARSLFETMTDEQSRRPCNVVTHPMTARAIAYFIIGHAQHHIGVIRDRYLYP